VVQTVVELVNARWAGASEAESNALALRMELQADCLAGVWGRHAGRDRQIVEPGGIEEGLRAAAAIGDDCLQRLSCGYVHYDEKPPNPGSICPVRLGINRGVAETQRERRVLSGSVLRPLRLGG